MGNKTATMDYYPRNVEMGDTTYVMLTEVISDTNKPE